MGIGFDFIVIVPLLPSPAISSLSLGVEYLSLVDSSVLLSGCSTASCDFGAFAGGDEQNPSTPPS